MDYTKTFDGVEHQHIWTVMREMGFPKRIVLLIEAVYSEQQSAVRTDSGTTYWFNVRKGMRQGCIVSHQLFSAHTGSIMREDDNVRNGSREKKPRKAKTKMGERHHRYVWYDESGKQSGG